MISNLFSFRGDFIFEKFEDEVNVIYHIPLALYATIYKGILDKARDNPEILHYNPKITNIKILEIMNLILDEKTNEILFLNSSF
jgi:hypothetical protein